MNKVLFNNQRLKFLLEMIFNKNSFFEIDSLFEIHNIKINSFEFLYKNMKSLNYNVKNNNLIEFEEFKNKKIFGNTNLIFKIFYLYNDKFEEGFIVYPWLCKKYEKITEIFEWKNNKQFNYKKINKLLNEWWLIDKIIYKLIAMKKQFQKNFKSHLIFRQQFYNDILECFNNEKVILNLWL